MTDTWELPAVAPCAWGYMVRSESERGYYALVNGKDCSCPAGRMGQESCRHRRTVAAYVAELNKRDKRPVVPTNVIALIGEEPYRPGAA